MCGVCVGTCDKQIINCVIYKNGGKNTKRGARPGRAAVFWLGQAL